MLEANPVPGETIRYVARVTTLIELAEMDVLVAGNTQCRQRLVPHGLDHSTGKGCRFPSMAIRTLDARMFSRQAVTGLRVVEGGLLESLDDVAPGAIGGKLSRVGVLCVAVAAGSEIDSSELLVHMALGTLDRPMHTAERIARPIVIKGTHLPGVGVVASATITTQLRKVRILMAIRARGEPYSLPLFRAVTLGALDSSVRTH